MKYLFFDYDGTLTHDGVISQKNKEYLSKAQAQGHKIFLNTGRSKGNMPDHVLNEIPFDGMICGAGYMEYEGKVLFEEHMPVPALEAGLKYANDKGCRVLYEGVDNVYSNQPNQWLLNINEHLPFGDELRITNMTLGRKLDCEDRELFYGCKVVELPTYFEVMPENVGKATGLKFIEDNLGVAHEDIIVFGDSENDIEMIKFAHTSVIMNHAPEFLSEYATLRTESDENGVAEGIIKILNI
ncbi:MAG: HAD-IIB family hydrolase [Clostridia bacterium]|nr:HAD-IIB family hydrolase [Clostridia bacterium]